MKKTILFISLIVFLTWNVQCQEYGKQHTLISQPILIEDDDWKFEGSANILLVPENRNNPDSRLITLHFYKFPSKEKSDLPPVVFLGAGPGEPYNIEAFYNGARAKAWRWELNFVNQKRDVILINQRGNSDAPGLQISEFKYRWSNGGKLNKPFDFSKRNKNRKESYKAHIEIFKKSGVDLKGYDILHFVDDIETIRKQFNYKKLALIGNSFASQWALGYIQRYPKFVDRALLSYIEPLNHNYDNPDEIWKVFEKIDTYAQKDKNIAQHIPKEGLVEAFKTIINRLENKPKTVKLKNKKGEIETIVVGADDLRFSLTYPRAGSYRGEIESWPKYITEMYNGDFSTLASISKGRVYNSSSLMINPLFNNSLGISEERERTLNNSKAIKWLGEINDDYVSTRAICPSPLVSNDFRLHKKHDIPILLIQGDMDLNTPYNNAVFLKDYLENGHLLTVTRGFHNAKRALIFKEPVLMNKIYSFMNIDFQKEDFQDYRSSLPSHYELPEFNFWPIKGESIHERYINRN